MLVFTSRRRVGTCVCLVVSHMSPPKKSSLWSQTLLKNKVDARLKTPLRLDPVRPEYHRAVVTWNGIAGRFDAASTGSQMSSR